MNPRKTLARARNNPGDVRYSDFLALAVALGYRSRRGSGSHQVFVHPAIPLHLNVQPGRDGKAKDYQVRRLLRDIDEFDLGLEDE